MLLRCNSIDFCMSMTSICNSMKKCMDFAVHRLIELRSRCLSFIKHQLGALLNLLPSECFCSFFNRMVSGATRCSNELRMAVFLQFALQLNGELQATHCIRMGLGQGPPKGGRVLPAGTQQPLRAGHVHASYPEAAVSRSKNGPSACVEAKSPCHGWWSWIAKGRTLQRGVRPILLWWSRGESNSGPRKPPDRHLQAQSLV